MENLELRSIIRTAALKKDIAGVMALTEICDLSYERVSRVWSGSVSAKLSDVAHIADKLALKIKFVGKN